MLSNEKINLCVIELDFHFDLLDSLLKIVENTNYSIHVFTTKRNMELLKGIQYHDSITFYILNSFSKYLFLRKHADLFEQSDVIFINTIATDFGAYLALKDPSKIILRIHNINKQFNPNRSIYFPNSLFSFWKFSSYIVRQVILKLFPIHRRILNNRIQHFTFPDDGLKEYVINKKYLPAEKVIPSIPFKVFSSTLTPSEFDNELRITIIGGIDKKRRDYYTAIEALKHIYHTNKSNLKISLTLLGSSEGEYGEFIKEELLKIKHPSLRLTFFDSRVNESHFLTVMNSSHIIISPIIQDSKAEIYHETYGETKTSGSILDFMKFGILTLTPDYYSPPSELEKYILKYTDGINLAEILIDFYSNPTKLNLLNEKSKAFASKKYSKKELFSISHTIFTSIKNKGNV
jgi:hypothetical protein